MCKKEKYIFKNCFHAWVCVTYPYFRVISHGMSQLLCMMYTFIFHREPDIPGQPLIEPEPGTSQAGTSQSAPVDPLGWLFGPVDDETPAGPEPVDDDTPAGQERGEKAT